MQFLRRSLTGLFLLSLTIGLLAFAGNAFFEAVQERANRESRQRPVQERVLAVNTVEVIAQDVAPALTVFGQVQSRRTLEIRASTSGRVVQLDEDFEAGASVEVGQLLAQIDPTDAESDLEIARTNLAEAEAELLDAERNLELVRDEVVAAQAQSDLRAQALARQQDLEKRGVGTAAAIETAALAESVANQAVVSRRMSEASGENRVDVAKNNLSRARIALANAERDLNDTEVRAAFSGTLADVSIVEGGLVSSNERLATLVDPEALEVVFRLSTTQYARLLDENGRLAGAPVRATLDVLGLDLQAEGHITRVDAAVGEGQTGRLLFARLDSFAGFRPGDFVSVHIDEPVLTGVAVLPAASIDSANSVLALNDEGRLDVAQVELLRRQGDNVIVRAVDLEGRHLVAERSPLMGPGVRVRDLSTPSAPVVAGNGDQDSSGETGGDTIKLTPQRRAALIAAVESNQRMPSEAKERVLSQLKQENVPTSMVERIESRMGG